MTEPCPFCSQDHGAAKVLMGGVRWVTCPNIPKGWVAIGPDAVTEDLLITVVNDGTDPE